MRNRLFFLSFCGFALLGISYASGCQQETGQTAVQSAAASADEKITVRFYVASSRYLADKKIVFLNSKSDYRDPGNFTVVIFGGGIDDLRNKKGIRMPSRYYLKRTVRVTGTKTFRNGKPQIIVRSADQIDFDN